MSNEINQKAKELVEPNHLDYKIKNQFNEWVWKSDAHRDRYCDEWEAWNKFKQAIENL